MAPTKKTATKKTTRTKVPPMPPAERAVMVTTVNRGVFFGYATKTDGETIRIARARNCLYWHQNVKGVFGLAATGPSSQCRIGPQVPGLELRNVTSVTDVTPEAAAKWEAAPWA